MREREKEGAEAKKHSQVNHAEKDYIGLLKLFLEFPQLAGSLVLAWHHDLRRGECEEEENKGKEKEKKHLEDGALGIWELRHVHVLAWLNVEGGEDWVLSIDEAVDLREKRSQRKEKSTREVFFPIRAPSCPLHQSQHHLSATG